MILYVKGQRWISEAEPELGLGTVLSVNRDQVCMLFAGSGETRHYAIQSAPLNRVLFKVGDQIQNFESKVFCVTSLTEEKGVITYHSENETIEESQLCDSMSFNKPEERLLSGHVDEYETFDLRFDALRFLHRAQKSKVRGFLGGRIDLIPHQLFIAEEITGRLAPRVLLADEVGLGKTIEACLIIHRLILNGRANRILIIVPDSLIHQWFVELYRRFNLWFLIFDSRMRLSISFSWTV